MTLAPFEFTLREDNARSSYAMQACADRLATAVTFDDEDTSDHASVITRFNLDGSASRDPRAHRMAHAVAPVSRVDRAPTAPSQVRCPWSDDEITAVNFAVPS